MLHLDAQMSTTLLKSHFQAPALHEIPDDLFCCLDRVGRKQGFRRMLARWITSQDPTNRQRIGARAVPQCCASADLQGSLPLTIPVQGELLPDGFCVQ